MKTNDDTRPSAIGARKWNKINVLSFEVHNKPKTQSVLVCIQIQFVVT